MKDYDPNVIYLNINEAAKVLRIPKNEIKRRIETQQLRAIFRKRWLIHPNQLEEQAILGLFTKTGESKMAFESVKDILEKYTNGKVKYGAGGSVLLGLAISNTKAGKGERISFRLGKDIQKETRLIEGDRIDIQFDNNIRRGLIKRDNVGIAKLSAIGGHKKRINGPNTLSASVRWISELPNFGKATRVKYEVDSGGCIYFDYPEGTILPE